MAWNCNRVVTVDGPTRQWLASSCFSARVPVEVRGVLRAAPRRSQMEKIVTSP